jgi:hypothetical protein
LVGTASAMRPGEKHKRLSDRQLRQVCLSRQPRSRMTAIGALARETLEQARTAANPLRVEVLELLGQVADDEFRRCCTLGDVRRGEVVILVKDPDCLYHIRVTWHLRLKGILERMCRHGVIRGIKFRSGSGGDCFPPAEGDDESPANRP